MSDVRPLKQVWVRWCKVPDDWTRWHAFDAGQLAAYGMRYAEGPTCSTSVGLSIYEIEVACDTPPEKDCCKKCLRKVHADS